MNNALQLKSPELSRALEPLSDADVRVVVMKCAAKALYVAHVESPIIQKALEVVEAEEYGNEQTIADLRKLADDIEAPYVAALDASRPVDNDERLMHLFRQARAVIALSLAMSTDIRAQGGNAVYEALYAGLPEADAVRFVTDVTKKSHS